MSTPSDTGPGPTKSDAVYHDLRRMIIRGTLPPGCRLDQVEMAERLGVSRMPLRHALLRLHAEGLVVMPPRRSAAVAEFDIEEISDTYFTRLALEPMLARAGTLRAGPEVPLQMQELNDAMEQAGADGDTMRYVDLDRLFHRTLYAAARHKRAVEMVEQLRDSTDRYVHFYASTAQRIEHSVAQHQAVIDAVRARDDAESQRVIERHIAEGRDVLLRVANRASSGDGWPYTGEGTDGTRAQAGRAGRANNG